MVVDYCGKNTGQQQYLNSKSYFMNYCVFIFTSLVLVTYSVK